jgi:membrane protease YdiL (CAAX protease family)
MLRTPLPRRGRTSPLRALGALWRSTALVMLWGVLLGATLLPWRPRWTPPPGGGPAPEQLGMEVLGLATLLAATFVMTRLVDRHPLAAVGLHLRSLPRGAAAGAAAGTAWLLATVGLAALLGGAGPGDGRPVAAGVLAASALWALVNAATQELLFHGYVFRAVERAGGRGAALAVTSGVFAAAHLPAFRGAWLPALNVFLAGTLLGLLTLRARSLWPAVAAHWAWNTLLGPVLGLTVSGKGEVAVPWRLLTLGGSPIVTGGAFGLEGSVAATATTALGLLALARWRPAGRLLRGGP